MTKAFSSDSLTNLHRLLVDRFNLDELRTLCFDLNVDYDTLRGEEKSAKARELITVMLRQNRLAELAAKLQALRPNVDWPNLETLSPEERLAWTTATEMSSAADYLVALRDYCANLPYLTLHDIRPPKTLDQVYVPLKAQQQMKDPKGLGDPSGLERPEPLSISDVMRRCDPPQVLILGEPGAGKSTLLRQLAEHAWDAPDKIGLDAPHLPILVPLRRLASAEGPLEERLNRALTAELTLTQVLPQGFFTNWPKQTGANWLILLDALDEVPAAQRPQLMQWLKGLLGRIGQNRVVLTSRPSGYAQGELDDKLFGHCDLLSFTPDQTGEFAHKWFGDKADQFLKELERVRAGALSGTPLLLTIAAKVYLEKGTLPERRSGLYEQFVDIWLSEAEQRGLRAELGELVCDIAKFVLARLALVMTEQPVQTEASLSKVAVDYLRDAVPLTPERAEIAGEKFLKVMARRSGVFTRRGDAYGFIHPTFREYLAAYTVVQDSKRDNGYDLEHVWQLAVSRWTEEDWREVALSVLSVLSDASQDVTALVNNIWRGGSREGLYFSGAALAEQVKVETNLCDDIIDKLLASTHEATWQSFAALIELRNYPRVGKELLALACDGKASWEVRELAVLALDDLGLADETAQAWLSLARDNQVYAWVRERATAVLDRLGRADDLLALARDEKVEGRIRERAAEALGHLGRTEEASQAWLTLIHDKTSVNIHQQAIEVLSKLGRAGDLLELARDRNVSWHVRVEAAEASGKLGQVDKAVSILLSVACGVHVIDSVCKQAAEAIVKLGRADALLAQARDETVKVWDRWHTVETLGEFADNRVLPDLERIAQNDSSGYVRYAVQKAIKQIRKRTEHQNA